MKNALIFLLLLFVGATAFAADKKIVFVAGPPSHGPREHEYRADCLLLKKCLDGVSGIKSTVYSNGWPSSAEAFSGADTIVLAMDGGGNDPALQADHLEQLGAEMKRGAGLVCLHYAVEPTIERGEKEFLQWLGGAFEINHSVNPTWVANFQELPQHSIARGVKPFEIRDEWYFFMRFPEGMTGVTPILAAVAPPSTMSRRDGPHEGNAEVRASVAKGEKQTVAWAYERPDGGRGFGFTGGHYHKNWADENFRKVVLNAILWTAKADVPENGVGGTVSAADLDENLDAKPAKK